MPQSLFHKNNYLHTPLAERMRPKCLDDFVGQEEIITEGKILRQAIENDAVPSMIFWGPPGSGKTTLARIIAEKTKFNFISLSAVSATVKDVREVISRAEDNLELYQKKTILFIDEIHRFNKAQQDALLPAVEQGIILLIGATTENPSFEINSALLSRSRVFIFKSLSPENIIKLINNVLKNKECGLGNYLIDITPEDKNFLASQSNGDARAAYNVLEFIINQEKKDSVIVITLDKIKEGLQKVNLLYDKNGEEHYNLISALHKSMRGSDGSAALYWLIRMLEGGEDPLYIARRLIRFASEDIGISEPQALVQAVAAYNACHYLGMPECGIHLAQATAYLAGAPKSNKLYEAYQKIQAEIKSSGNLPVPLHLRNAPTKLMEDLDYGKSYKYNPNYKETIDQEYLPKSIKKHQFWLTD